MARSNKNENFHYKQLFVYISIVLLVFTGFQCKIGVFLSGVLFVMPYLEYFRKEAKESTGKRKGFFVSLVASNLIIAAISLFIYFGMEIDYSGKVPMLFTNDTIKLFYLSIQYWILFIVFAIWWVLNFIIIILNDGK